MQRSMRANEREKEQITGDSLFIWLNNCLRFFLQVVSIYEHTNQMHTMYFGLLTYATKCTVAIAVHFKSRIFFVLINFTSVKSIWRGSESIYRKARTKVIMKPIWLKTRCASSSSFIDFTTFFALVFQFFICKRRCVQRWSIYRIKQSKMEPSADHCDWCWVCFCFRHDHHTQ